MATKQKTVKFILAALLIVISVIMISPFIVMVLTSFKSMKEIRSAEFIWIPENFSLKNYVAAMEMTTDPDALSPKLFLAREVLGPVVVWLEGVAVEVVPDVDPAARIRIFEPGAPDARVLLDHAVGYARVL